jgi:hypothetical protein
MRTNYSIAGNLFIDLINCNKKFTAKQYIRFVKVTPTKGFTCRFAILKAKFKGHHLTDDEFGVVRSHN